MNEWRHLNPNFFSAKIASLDFDVVVVVVVVDAAAAAAVVLLSLVLCHRGQNKIYDVNYNSASFGQSRLHLRRRRHHDDVERFVSWDVAIMVEIGRTIQWRNHLLYTGRRTLTYLVRGSITLRLTSCLAGLDSAKEVNLLFIEHKQLNLNESTAVKWDFPLTSTSLIFSHLVQPEELYKLIRSCVGIQTHDLSIRSLVHKHLDQCSSQSIGET